MKWLAPLACLALSACISTKAVKNSDFSPAAAIQAKLAIMPAQASVLDVDYGGNVTSVQETDREVASEMVQALHAALAEKGRQVTVATFDEAFFRANPERRFQLTEVQDAAETAITRVFHEGASKEAGDYYGLRPMLTELGPVVSGLDADALLFARCQVVNSRTQANTPEHRAEVEMVLVDPGTGEVLRAGRATKESPAEIDVAPLALAALDSLD